MKQNSKGVGRQMLVYVYWETGWPVLHGGRPQFKKKGSSSRTEDTRLSFKERKLVELGLAPLPVTSPNRHSQVEL